MQFQNLLVVLLATALGTSALPQGQPDASVDDVQILSSELVEASEAPDYARGVTVKFWGGNNGGCNTTPAFRTMQIPYTKGCQRLNIGKVGSTMVVKNGLQKKCKMSVYNTVDCTAGNFYVVPSGTLNCWAQDVKSVKITC